MTAAIDWPEGVVARYLTLGGATVDITAFPDECTARADCTAPNCGMSHTERDGETYTRQLDRGARPKMAREEALRVATWLAGEWAQGHAEACRSMPKPEAGNG